MRIHYTSVLVLSICAGLISCQADETRLPPAPGAVVIPGNRPAKGQWATSLGLTMPAPLIVKYRDDKTDSRTALEEALR